jgi:HlyD family secretion protein
LLRLEVQLDNAQATLKNFLAYVSPRTQRQLDVQVESKELTRSFNEIQYQRSQERLEHLQDLIEHCTLRAPHDGILIYANLLFWDAPKLSEGGHVHFGMRMFYLPDLSKLVMQAQLFESVVDQVKVGMSATVRLEAFPGQEIQGRVISIDPVPTDNWRAGLDIHQFRAQIELIDPPPGTLPDMSAQARIVTGRREDALVVPTEALAIVDGWPYCYVEGPDGLERRLVSLGTADEDNSSVVAGLSEGDRVVLDPTPLRVHPEATLDPMHDAAPCPTDTTSHRAPPASDHPA